MRSDLSAIRTTGAMLPGSLLTRIAAGESDLGGLTSKDFHLPPGETPREAANRAWTYLTGVWATYRDALATLPDGDPAVGLTRERWLLILFRELGYGQLPSTPAGGIVVGDDERAYAVSHLWGRTPIHLLGWGVDLDRRTKGVAGAATRAPHAMVQELLNRSDTHLWGIVGNGQVLRLLRDSASLSGQAYVEFDLDAIFSGELFSDFVVLYLLLHESRVAVDSPEASPAECWLERWRTSAATSGARAMDLLRDGVRRAIDDLGTGFLRHPANADLRARLDDGTLTLGDYHLSLLRLVYRLLFLFVAEDRQALLHPTGDPVAAARYRDHYSTTRLRRVARVRRGTQHGDHWVALRLVMDRLGDEGGCPELALPGIGGLFDTRGTHDLSGLSLANEPLLSAVRALSIVAPKGQPRQVVDYKNLGAEELGSIYESLLELVPRRNRAEGLFTLEALAGNDRKTSGSYYTPTSLIDLVLDETLTPLLDAADRTGTAAEREAALLRLTVCDPAVGSGHFLVAAGRRIAERLAVVRTGEVDPTPADITSALHDVVATCLYGVDVNPLAAELAKVSLWLESMQAGRPLTFLDAHLKVGNSLLGATPALIAAGLPDEAFVALDGDDKKATATLKKKNKRERDEREAAQGSFFEASGLEASNSGIRSAMTVATGSGHLPTSLAELHGIEQRYAEYAASQDLARERLVADTWCAAFVQHKGAGEVEITASTIDAATSGALDAATLGVVHGLAAQYGFFHWHLEFPDIFEVSASTTTEPNGWRGGFAAMVGNPPWERIKLQEQEFFAQRDAAVAGAANAAARKKAIAALRTSDPALSEEWRSASRQAEAASHVLRKSGRYPLCGVGDVNTYAVFAELFRSSLAPDGRMGIITPTGIATDATTQAFFRDVLEKQSLAALLDFRNAGFFDGVASAQGVRFCILSLSSSPCSTAARIVFRARSVLETSRADRIVYLTADEMMLLNPNTGTCPVFLSRRDADITLDIYRRHPVLVNDRDRTNPWGLRFGTLFHMANDSGLFETADDLRGQGAAFDGWAWVRGTQRWLPLYEAKMLNYYDHRHGDYALATIKPGKEVRAIPTPSSATLNDPSFEITSRYWVAENQVEHAIGDRWNRSWLLGWRDIATSLDARTFIPSVLPRSAVGHVFPIALLVEPHRAPLLQCILSSLVLDYIARQKLSGTHMTYGVVHQLALPKPAVVASSLPGVSEQLDAWALPRILELTYTSYRISSYAADVLGLPDGADPGPPYCWIPERREQLRAELDAAMFHLYGLRRDEVEHVLDSFPVVRKYEERDHGEFRTKRLVLEIYDAMADAAARDTTFVSPLTPPPGDGPRHPTRAGGIDHA